ncbi:MAG: VanZ family protein [Lachnospiraceae bacterium]|nr:VanZ family protein [Lachnospiraceae bacterium]
MIDRRSNVRKNLILLYVHYLLFALWIALMVVIVWFSSKDAAESTEQSLSVGKWICHIIVSGYDNMTDASQLDYAMLLDKFVRKSAHFCEYAALGALTYNASYVIFEFLRLRNRVKLKTSYMIIASILWCILFAASDEIHQLFVPGRYGSPLDVLLDTLGATLGIFLVRLIAHLITRSKSPSKQADT